mgnify:CR=1 FL=1
MTTQQSKVFLSKIQESINKGDYDKYMTVPFMSKKLLYAAIKAKVVSKEARGNNPILTDSEIKECINDAKETAAYTAAVLFRTGILEKGEDGKLCVSKKGQIAIRDSLFKINDN